jgi:hypothetical protein
MLSQKLGLVAKDRTQQYWDISRLDILLTDRDKRIHLDAVAFV